jgi:predicted regulator of Ras-like GTPase activity (Roadblock/LC7/MglB family)
MVWAMSETKGERLAAALNEFISSSPDVEAAAVVSFDGLAMASVLPDDMDEDRLGAMSAALLSLGEQAASGLGRGELHQVFVEADEGFVFLMSARDEAVLAAVTGRQAKIGLMLYEMRHTAQTVGTLLAAGREDEPGEEPEEHTDDRPAAATVAEISYAVGPPPQPADETPNGSSPAQTAAPWS